MSVHPPIIYSSIFQVYCASGLLAPLAKHGTAKKLIGFQSQRNWVPIPAPCLCLTVLRLHLVMSETDTAFPALPLLSTEHLSWYLLAPAAQHVPSCSLIFFYKPLPPPVSVSGSGATASHSLSLRLESSSTHCSPSLPTPSPSLLFHLFTSSEASLSLQPYALGLVNTPLLLGNSWTPVFTLSCPMATMSMEEGESWPPPELTEEI